MKASSLCPISSIAALAFALLPGTASAVAYVLYYHTFGDWSVVCWRGMVQGEKSCYIDAPHVDYNIDPHTSTIRIEPVGNAVHVVVSARSGTAHGVKVELAVDGHDVEEGVPDRLDHVNFEGANAAALIEKLRRGRVLTIDLPDVEQTIRISLADFDKAYAAFEENLDRFETPVGETPVGRAPAGAALAPQGSEPPQTR